MGIGSSLRRFGRRVEGQTRHQVDRAKDPNKGIWGSNPYARWAERLTGVSTFKSAVGRHTNGGELDGQVDTQEDPFDAAKNDARKGRPTKAYTDETVNRPEGEARAAQEKLDLAERDRMERERTKSRNAIAVRIRRSNRPDTGPRSSVVSGGLGTTGSAASTFAALLGL